MMNYYLQQRKKQLSLIGTPIFNGDKGFGKFNDTTYRFVLNEGNNNLFNDIREEVKRYFSENDIAWWNGNGPNGHILSSQIACLNHLFAIRRDREAVLSILNGVRNEFVDVLPLECDKDRQYIAFEVVSTNDNLKEINTSRGANCTSVDALIMAKHHSGEIWLIPIEWKYTEHYEADDKSTGEKGATRIKRYNSLIKSYSDQLKWFEDFKVYYQEPFYQLMRQTLWAEQMILNKDREILKADDFLHIHVIPQGNEELLKNSGGQGYIVSGKGMEETWRSCLKDQSKYVIVDHQQLLSPIAHKYPTLFAYLQARYW